MSSRLWLPARRTLTPPSPRLLLAPLDRRRALNPSRTPPTPLAVRSPTHVSTTSQTRLLSCLTASSRSPSPSTFTFHLFVPLPPPPLATTSSSRPCTFNSHSSHARPVFSFSCAIPILISRSCTIHTFTHFHNLLASKQSLSTPTLFTSLFHSLS